MMSNKNLPNWYETYNKNLRCVRYIPHRVDIVNGFNEVVHDHGLTEHELEDLKNKIGRQKIKAIERYSFPCSSWRDV
jgi:hypothetical protein